MGLGQLVVRSDATGEFPVRAGLVLLLSAVPLVLGWSVARAISADTWGYPDEPPRTDVGGARLVALSFVRVADAGSPVALQRAAMIGAMSSDRCTRNDPSDCTLGRSLWTHLSETSAVASLPEVADPVAEIVVAEKSGGLFTGSGGRCGTTLVAELALTDGKTGWLIGHQSCELFDDRYRYSEVLMVDGRARQALAYSFDVAGIEFATPAVLKVTSLLAFATTFGCGVLVGWLVSALRRNRANRRLPVQSTN